VSPQLLSIFSSVVMDISGRTSFRSISAVQIVFVFIYSGPVRRADQTVTGCGPLLEHAVFADYMYAT
jgi:hypothetical protein